MYYVLNQQMLFGKMYYSTYW